MEEFQVLHDVHVLAVEARGHEVHVDLYGSEDNICGHVRFVFPAWRERAERLRTLRSWERHDTRVTFVGSAGTVTLLNDAALLARIADPAH